ncbi:MAG: DNA repair protein RadC [Rhodocyclaceae bacterium]|jgi:DNA repair protein RadC|nr:DNA repair protein RadC [Rhodocyclaceae bacterium]
MSCVIADSRPESLTLIAAQHEDWIIQQAITLLEERVFKAGQALGSPAAVRDYLRLKLVAEPNEVFAVVFLDSQHQVLAFEPLFKGSVDQTSVYPRVVVQRALALNASALILAHQHPSGVTEPSVADRALTDRLKAALAMVDVRVVDHFIVGKGNPYSFAEAGLL